MHIVDGHEVSEREEKGGQGVTGDSRRRSWVIPPALFRGCLSRGLSCPSGECPGIEGGRVRGWKEKDKKIERNKRESIFLLILLHPKSSHIFTPFYLTQKTFSGKS